MERLGVSFFVYFPGVREFVLVHFATKSEKKNDHDLMLTIFILLGSLFLAEKNHPFTNVS